MKYVLWVLFLLLVGCSSSLPQALSPSEESLARAAQLNAQLGMEYLKNGNIGKAKHKLLLALKQDSKSPEVLGAMGYFQEHTGNFTAAQSYYSKALQVSGSSGTSHNNYGAFLCRQGQYQASLSHFIAATQDPNYLTPGEAFENAGLCAEQIPNLSLAKRYFRRAVENNPQLVRSLLELAQLYYWQNNNSQALKYFHRYEQLGNLTPKALFLGIKIYQKAGKMKIAQHYEQLLKTNYSDSKEYKQRVSNN